MSVVAVPLFLWFSTRLFAGIRTSLNNIYDVSVRPPKGHYVVRYLLAKLRGAYPRLLDDHTPSLQAGLRTLTALAGRVGKDCVIWRYDPIVFSNLTPLDFHRRDLYEAIEKGNYPEWELGIQLIPEGQESKFDFDVLDGVTHELSRHPRFVEPTILAENETPRRRVF